VATLVKRAPFRELDAIERHMQRMVGEVYRPFMPPLPAADIYETADEFVVELEVPGYKETELSIEVSDHTLKVSGEHTQTTDDKDKTFWLQERLGRRFERRFGLPVATDIEHVQAVFKSGVLELHAPKLQTVTPRKVEIAKP
jgi:HSP20 family protein